MQGRTKNAKNYAQYFNKVRHWPFAASVRPWFLGAVLPCKKDILILAYLYWQRAKGQ